MVQKMTSCFASRLLTWFYQHGRHDLPWQQQPTPYRVWISEIMLQQTQVSTVIDYYSRFLTRFPNMETLAAAEQDEVLHLWAGLGYYSRARNLHRCAQLIMTQRHGELPVACQSAMEALPGIGRSTAAAIRALSTGARAVILDGNVKRVLTRYAGISGWPGEKPIERQLWALADQLTPTEEVAAYTQAMMDLGALICKPRQPRCQACPQRLECIAYREQRIGEWPTPKPKKVRPQIERHFLLLEQHQRWLLERQPEQGLWGGLWSLPEFETEAALHDWLTEQQVSVKAQRQPGIEHAFTHYQLLMHPWSVQLEQALPHSDTKKQIWYDPSQPAAIGLPAPVAKLLARQAADTAIL